MAEKINILGTEYTIFRDVEMPETKAGNVDFVKKEIKICNDHTQQLDIALRHEIMHAFFYEAGLMKYADDEVLTDFLAMQYHKIVDLMNFEED